MWHYVSFSLHRGVKYFCVSHWNTILHHVMCDLIHQSNEGPEVVRHVLVLNYLKLRLRHVRHHGIRWSWRLIFITNLCLVIIICCGKSVVSHIDVVNIFWLVHKLHVLAYFTTCFLCIVELFILLLSRFRRATLYFILWKLNVLIFCTAVMTFRTVYNMDVLTDFDISCWFLVD